MKDFSELQITRTDRNVDIVFCVDGTGSMSPIINDVKENIKRFRVEFLTKLAEAGTNVQSLRTKLIVFRDYGCDADAMEVSDFYDLTSGVDEAAFEEKINSISVHGGGDAPENGLEALVYAMKSDFHNKRKDRQVIVLFTDAEAIPLLERKGNPGYPEDMLNDEELQELWSCAGKFSQEYPLGDHQKRLVLFAPVGTVYESIKMAWNRVEFTPVEPDKGMIEINFDTIISALVSSVSNV